MLGGRGIVFDIKIGIFVRRQRNDEGGGDDSRNLIDRLFEYTESIAVLGIIRFVVVVKEFVEELVVFGI